MRNSRPLKDTTDYFTRKAACLHDLWPFTSKWCSWCSSRPIKPLQCFFIRRSRSRFRYKMGTSSTICKWNSLRKCPGRFVQDEDGTVCSASDSISKKLIEIEQCQSDDQETQLQSPEWKDWDSSIGRESRMEKSQRRKECRRMLSVESNLTVVKTRLLQFQPRKWSWTKSTIVLS